MTEEFSDLRQIIELYGRGLRGAWKGIRIATQGKNQAVLLSKIKLMQLRMKLHYASTGTRDTMKLSDLEKLTGDDYGIYNVPFEKEEDIRGFYDRLKELKVSFAELPDLNPGDGYTQIAFHKKDAANINAVANYYKEKLSIEGAEISLEAYDKMATEEGKALLDELAQKGYEKEKQMDQLMVIRERNHDDGYTPISINIESLLKREEKDCYCCRIPGTYQSDKSFQVIRIKKEDCLLIDKGQTIFTHLKKGELIDVYHASSKGTIDFEHKSSKPYEDIIEKYHGVHEDKMKQIDRIGVRRTDALPNFNQGEDAIEIAPDKTKLSAEENMEKIINIENYKQHAKSDEYLPVTIDVKDQFVGEENGMYLAKVPNSFNAEENSFLCYKIKKDYALFTSDKQKIFAHIKKNTLIECSEYNGASQVTKKRIITSDEIVKKYADGKQNKDSLEKQLLRAAQRKSTLVPSAPKMTKN